eukprot:766975-Hanusia_phi.AAC.1
MTSSSKCLRLRLAGANQSELIPILHRTVKEVIYAPARIRSAPGLLSQVVYELNNTQNQYNAKDIHNKSM